MKRKLLSKTIFPAFLLGILLVPVSQSLGLGSDAAKSDGKDGKDIGYEVPADKAEKWQDIKDVLANEYDVCLEHCGNDKYCTDRCYEVYKYRLDTEYKALTDGKAN